MWKFSCFCLTLASFASACAFDLVSREDWQAKPPLGEQAMSNPVAYVIIHHSYIPAACHDNAGCVAAMQNMQNMHQQTNGWDDIGYSFAVGGDGRAYEGRGWSKVGAHAPNYNSKSIGICVIGDWRTELPPNNQMSTIKELIDFGVQKGYIGKDYVLHGHRQVRNGTECPGDALFNEISTWDHFSDQVTNKFYPTP